MPKTKEVINEFVKEIIRKILLKFRLLKKARGVKILFSSPMKKVLKELKKRDKIISEFSALEVFGGDGTYTKNYFRKVYSLDVWEINSQFEQSLKNNLPKANIKITNSYKEILNTEKKFNFLVIDNYMSVYGEQRYCEHFDLFPDIFTVCSDSAILILNVIPCVSHKDKKEYPNLFNKDHLERRRVFYKTDKPENITFGRMIEIYSELCENNSFRLLWHFVQRRFIVYYCILQIERK